MSPGIGTAASDHDPRGSSTRGWALQQAAAEVIPGGVNSATRYVGHPYAFGGATAPTSPTLDGHRYLDYHAAFGAILLGHNSPRGQRRRSRAAVGTLDLFGLGVTELEVELATRVTEAIPSAEMMIATMSGSEATAQAVRLARAATGRPLLVKFQGGFHGWHDAVARNVISRPELAYGHDPLSAGILDTALESTLIAEFNDLDSVRALFEQFPERIAAVIIEPIPHNVGALVPDPGVRRRPARADQRARVPADLRRGHHRLPPRPRRLPGGLRRPARPHHVRQGHGQRLPDRRAGRAALR